MMQIYRLFPIYQLSKIFLGKFYDEGRELEIELFAKIY